MILPFIHALNGFRIILDSMPPFFGSFILVVFVFSLGVNLAKIAAMGLFK